MPLRAEVRQHLQNVHIRNQYDTGVAADSRSPVLNSNRRAQRYGYWEGQMEVDGCLTDRLVLRAGANLEGDVETARIVIEEGNRCFESVQDISSASRENVIVR